MQIITFSEYEQRNEEGILALIDENTVPVPYRVDYIRRNKNLLANKLLCDNCDGTGNEFYHMYHSCPECNGTGVKQ